MEEKQIADHQTHASESRLTMGTKSSVFNTGGTYRSEVSRASVIARSLGRFYVILLSGAAVTASILAACSCAFFAYRSLDGEPWKGLEPPFNELAEASVGFFSYSELNGSNGLTSAILGDQCIRYDEWSNTGQSMLFYVAQWCSIFAPVAGFLGLVQLVLEVICCRLRGSAAFVNLCFFAAAGLQGCTFLIFGETEFCFAPESQNKCYLKVAAWYSIGCTAAYLILAITMILIPSYPVSGSKWCFVFTNRRGIPYNTSQSHSEGSLGKKSRQSGDTQSSYDMCDEENQNPDVTPVWDDVPEDNGIQVSRSDDNLDTDLDMDMDMDVGIMDTDLDLDLDLDMDLVDDRQSNLNMAIREKKIPVSSEKAVDDSLFDDASEGDRSERSRASHRSRALSLKSVRSEKVRHPDFFDMACCGDPLHLEQFLTARPKKKNRKSTKRSKSSGRSTSGRSTSGRSTSARSSAGRSRSGSGRSKSSSRSHQEPRTYGAVV